MSCYRCRACQRVWRANEVRTDERIPAHLGMKTCGDACCDGSCDALANTILEANLRTALAIAIDNLAEGEARVSPAYKSALRAGFEDVLDAARAGEPIVIVRD